MYDRSGSGGDSYKGAVRPFVICSGTAECAQERRAARYQRLGQGVPQQVSCYPRRLWPSRNTSCPTYRHPPKRRQVDSTGRRPRGGLVLSLVLLAPLAGVIPLTAASCPVWSLPAQAQATWRIQTQPLSPTHPSISQAAPARPPLFLSVNPPERSCLHDWRTRVPSLPALAWGSTASLRSRLSPVIPSNSSRTFNPSSSLSWCPTVCSSFPRRLT